MKIDFDSSLHTITVDEVVMSLELLQCLAHPDPDRYYQFSRVGNIVTVTHLGDFRQITEMIQ